jgi:hypothetical protein
LTIGAIPLSLVEDVEDCVSQSSPLTAEVILPETFKAQNIEKIGGCHILWIDCLAEHLHLNAVHKQCRLPPIYVSYELPEPWREVNSPKTQRKANLVDQGRDALCQPDRNLPSDSIRSMTCHVFFIYAEPDMF